MSKPVRFLIDGDQDGDTADLWPDGDGPENPTAADVAALMREQCRNPLQWMSDWCMSGPIVEVVVDGEMERVW